MISDSGLLSLSANRPVPGSCEKQNVRKANIISLGEHLLNEQIERPARGFSGKQVVGSIDIYQPVTGTCVAQSA